MSDISKKNMNTFTDNNAPQNTLPDEDGTVQASGLDDEGGAVQASGFDGEGGTVQVAGFDGETSAVPQDNDNGADDSSAPLGTVFSEDDAADFHSREFLFSDSFTVSEVRRKAVSLQKGKLLRLYPKMLLYCALLMLPPLIVYIVSLLRIDSHTPAAAAAYVIAVLFPLVLGGPLSLGLVKGFIEISRGENDIRMKSLFYAFKDQHFFRDVYKRQPFSSSIG